MPTLIVRHPDGTENEYELTGELKIGRHDSNDLVLTEGGVSRQHARLFVEGGKVLVEDLGSSNGTYVDGERVSEAVALTPQSQLAVGDYELKLKGGARGANGARKGGKSGSAAAVAPALGSDEGAPRATRALPSVKPARPPGAQLAKRERPAPGAAPAASGAGPVLRGLTGPWANKTYPLKGKLVVGRMPPAAVLLEDDSISRKHAEVERNARGVAILRDLGSANGTLLNGERIGQEPLELTPGDIIQFGMVEMVYEAEEGAAVPARRERGGAAGRDAAPAAASGGSRKLLVVAGALVALILVAGVVKKVSGGSGGTGNDDPGVPKPPDPTVELQETLSACRSFASMEMGNEPQWAKAEVACDKALNIDPINAEANTLIKRIKIEKQASDYFAQGTKALERLKEEDALDLFRKIPRESQYFRRAKLKVDEALTQVKDRAERDCKQYLRDSAWSAAVPRCERYMGFWCQGKKDEIEPPLGFTLVLDGRPRAAKKEWQPKDKLFLQFLQARRKLDPNVAPWVCPESEYFREEERGTTPAEMAKKAFRERYSENLMFAAMQDYWAGRGNEALTTLQKLRSNYEKSSFHGQADLLIKDVSTVDQLFKTGQALLQDDAVEKAAEPFDEALEVDKRLMGDLWERAPSFYRRNILQDIASKAFIAGKAWADREDRRRGCRIWKLGFRFYKGNTDLNKVVGFCSTQASNAFQSAQSCEDLLVAADYAVPGDGIDEKIAQWKQEWKCK
jgi:pSer/pThr/pTyr-binding forkhead associated (FHA) protein/tetratricopeptide (TPR) repeat protein